ncbi:MAG: CerR family C-terminal domain-containing protein [Caulobacteraceae bacterium]|nr:CerR family C-terminal domain-containing protein [Caulobacteraceae bacterium]
MSEARANAPRRRPDRGGYARGEETRARIIAAALRVFAEEGYARASTRQIAEAAGVTPPALQYYFDSKEGLHRACAQFIVGELGQILGPPRRQADAAAETGDPRRALEALCDLLDSLVEVSLVAKTASDWGRFIGRAQTDGEGPAAGVIREEVSRPLHACVSRLVGVILSLSPKAQTTQLRASMVLGPISAFHSGKSNTLAILGWPDYEGERLTAVKAALRAHTRAALSDTGDARSRS